MSSTVGEQIRPSDVPRLMRPHHIVRGTIPLVPNHSQRIAPSDRAVLTAPAAWTIESTKLPHFHPRGLEVDAEGVRIHIDNPYINKPVMQDESVGETDRSWHNYKPHENKYFLPNDDAELCRLDRQHEMWLRLLNGQFHKAPLSNPKRVLDIGTGSGIWAVEYARSHPSSDVVGVDISKPSPEDCPPNCTFELHDFTDPWHYEEKFDLIHARLIFAAKQDVPLLLRRAYDALAPGGYIEHQELYGMPLDIGDGSLRGTYLEEFFFNTVSAARDLGINMLSLPRYAQWMREAGFEDVTEVQSALPINPWPRGRFYKQLGAIQNKNLEVGLGAIYSRMLAKGLGWSPEKTAEAVARAREQINDGSIHAYFPVYVVYGRKPLSATS